MKITIQTDADFTPKGKRTARVAPYGHQIIRWYVSGRIYHTIPFHGDNLALTQLWLEA